MATRVQICYEMVEKAAVQLNICTNTNYTLSIKLTASTSIQSTLDITNQFKNPDFFQFFWSPEEFSLGITNFCEFRLVSRNAFGRCFLKIYLCQAVLVVLNLVLLS